MMYNHVPLHPSQQVGDPPRVKRNFVRKIVKQFNEEARQRERIRKEHELRNGDPRDLSPYRSSSPPIISPTIDTAPNNNHPFSYTSSQPPPFFYKKSKSEHNLKNPDEVIYAQVVVNGHAHNGLANKTTVHTKVPIRNGYVVGKSTDKKSSMNRNQSVSMSSLQGKNGRIQETSEARPTMTHKKFTSENQHQQHVYKSVRSPSPEINFPVASSRKQTKEKKKEVDSRRVNGDVKSGRLDKSQTSFTESSHVHESVYNVNKEHATLNRDKRNDGDKRDGSTLRSDKKERAKSETRKEHHGKKSSQDHYDVERNTFSDFRSSNNINNNNKTVQEDRFFTAEESSRDSPDSRNRRQLEEEFFLKEPLPDYKDDRSDRLYTEKSSTRHREEKEIAGGREEMEHRTWSVKQMLNGNANAKKDSGRIKAANDEVDNFQGNSTNFRTAEYVKEEKVIRRHRASSSSSSPTRDESPVSKSQKEKHAKKEALAKKSEKNVEKQKVASHISASKRLNLNTEANRHSTLPANVGRENEREKKFYYFGANEGDLNLNANAGNRGKAKDKQKEKGNAALSSTRLVKEAHAKVHTSSQNDKIHVSNTSRNKNSDFNISESPIQSAHHDSGYSSRMGMTSSTPRSKSVSPAQPNEKIINVEVEGRKDHHYQHHNKNVHRTEYVGSAFTEDIEERMETSESDDIPNHWGFGSQESQVSAPSNQWSSLEEEEDEENVVNEHINTPQSIIREMDKREISYENSQKTRNKSHNSQLWFERTEVDSDYRRGLSTSGSTTLDHGILRNDNHVNNNLGSSATLSRLETNKNRINNDVSFRSATIDRRQQQQQLQQQQKQQQSRNRRSDSPSTAVRILLNGRDITNEEIKDSENNSVNARQSSRTGSYPSETESQHSNKSKGSRKSSGSSPVSKRVNFKTRSKAKRSVSSAANLSPVHREALMRASSPARPASASGSLNSSGSEASHGSNRSVILHATTVADIPPARSYRYRIYRDSPTTNGRKSGKSVSRTFSLLAPWKPKKYKQKYERRYDSSDGSQLSPSVSAEKIESSKKDRDSHSHDSSSEKLDSLSPLPSETPSGHETRRVTVARHNSMPKDTRFSGFFKKKKESPA